MMTLDDQTKLKISLENKLKPKLTTIFNVMANEFKLSIATNNSIRGFKYKSQFESILIDHYKKTQKLFRKINIKQDEDELEDEILLALLLWAEKQKDLSSNHIIETTQKNFDESINEARRALLEEGNTTFTQRELALVATVILKRKLKNRINIISMVETQAASESTKLIEEFSSAGLNPKNVVNNHYDGTTDKTKTWYTVGDKRVRPAHRAVDGQTVKINEPFIVKGEQLMYPGDTSMGASFGNVSGCRCSAVYNI